MKWSLVILASLVTPIGAAFALSQRAAALRSSSAELGPPQSVMYGHIRTMSRKGRRFELKFDPSWWLTGVTAQRAALEDTGSRDVPNDYYVVDEGHRLLTVVVLPSARITVLTGGTFRTRIPASELWQIVNGKNPKHRRLSERKAGFWLRIGEKYPNPAVTLDQQYQP